MSEYEYEYMRGSVQVREHVYVLCTCIVVCTRWYAYVCEYRVYMLVLGMWTVLYVCAVQVYCAYMYVHCVCEVLHLYTHKHTYVYAHRVYTSTYVYRLYVDIM